MINIKEWQRPFIILVKSYFRTKNICITLTTGLLLSLSHSLFLKQTPLQSTPPILSLSLTLTNTTSHSLPFPLYLSLSDTYFSILFTSSLPLFQSLSYPLLPILDSSWFFNFCGKMRWSKIHSALSFTFRQGPNFYFLLKNVLSPFSSSEINFGNGPFPASFPSL